MKIVIIVFDILLIKVFHHTLSTLILSAIVVSKYCESHQEMLYRVTQNFVLYPLYTYKVP